MNNQEKINKIMENLVGIQLNLKVLEKFFKKDMVHLLDQEKIDKYFEQAIQEYIEQDMWPTIDTVDSQGEKTGGFIQATMTNGEVKK